MRANAGLQASSESTRASGRAGAPPAALWTRVAVLALAGLCLLLTSAVSRNSTAWIGATFPGFFVLPNRVVASVRLPGWEDASPLFHDELLVADGVAVASAQSLYDVVAARPAGSRILYEARDRDGTRSVAAVDSHTFSGRDYALTFGTFLLNGIAFLSIGLFIAWMRPRDPAAHGLLAACLCFGLLGVTAVDLYGSSGFARLHLLALTLIPAGLLHLALVFPRVRFREHRRLVLMIVYGLSAALALAAQGAFDQPAAYVSWHRTAWVAIGAAAVGFVVLVACELLRTDTPIVQRRVGVAYLGLFGSLLAPLLAAAVSSLLDARIAFNVAAATAFLFPLGVAYAILEDDVLAVDAMLRRSLAYAVVVTSVVTIYFAVLVIARHLFPETQPFESSPAALALLNLGLLFLVSPLRDHAQAWIDRLVLRESYEIEGALSALGRALARSRTIEAVLAQTERVFADTIAPARTLLFQRDADGIFRAAAGDATDRIELAAPPAMAVRLERGDLVLRYAGGGGSGSPRSSLWGRLGIDLLVPIGSGGPPAGVLALGRKLSGHSYNAHDITFLRTAASQIALALVNAAAFDQLERLNQHLEGSNESLERQVRERTAALHSSNEELNQSLEKLQQAYRRLEQTHASLLRADRLATVGRLTAGLAHEMNTPLSAVLNSLKIIGDLGEEYAASIDDAEVLPEDHREIAKEITHTARSASDWANKAASYLRSVKSHGRDTRGGTAQRFLVRDVVDEARTLVAHRLRAASCQIDYVEEPADVALIGDPGRFGQVLVNLISNAIDAYEEKGILGGRIEVHATCTEGAVCVRVRDRAGGIPASVLPHIFDELYTTKGPGRGTGLGLWISRNLVEQGFGGTLDVFTNPEGSCFLAEFPPPDVETAEPAPTTSTKTAFAAAPVESASP